MAPLDPDRTEFLGDDVDYRDPLVRDINNALVKLGPELRALGHSHAHLDANARIFIARHLVHVIRERQQPVPTRHSAADLGRTNL